MPQHPMADDELVAFLTDEPARTGKLATVRADGRPHVAPSGSPSTRPIEGIATVGEDLEEVAHWATVIGGCYMGPENAGQSGGATACRASSWSECAPPTSSPWPRWPIEQGQATAAGGSRRLCSPDHRVSTGSDRRHSKGVAPVGLGLLALSSAGTTAGDEGGPRT